MSADRILAELLNRSRLLEYALAHVETATAAGGRPAQRDALKALYHTTQLFTLDAAQLRARAEAAGILAAGGGYNEEWLVSPEREEETTKEEGQDRKAEKTKEARAAAAPAPAEPPGAREKILVVDPDEGTRVLSTAMLRELGYRV
ncbi:MAG: hypothetical protein ACM3NS_05255, partial [Deltaproteobacteria bacterium]